MAHTTRYSFKGLSRLASDCGVSKSAVCRLAAGQTAPSYALVLRVVGALERHLGRTLDPREVVREDGEYPTKSTCALCGCRGCLPEEAYDEEGEIREEYRHVKPGEWTELLGIRKEEE
jgi:transcriptional regulator with XRE-family HTH domain